MLIRYLDPEGKGPEVRPGGKHSDDRACLHSRS